MTIQFLPYSVRGAAAMEPADTRPSGANRLVSHKVIIRADNRGQRTVPAELALLGPGDVVGIDPAQVVRRTPRPGDSAMAPNHLATVELAHPDLPWLFSADPNPTTDRMIPWLMLVVVEENPDDPGRGRITHLAGSPNPRLTVEGARLPNPAEAWAWAHVQVYAPDADAARAYIGGPGPWPLARARLMAPCSMRPQTGYLACLVPVFEAGRLAGLDAGSIAEAGAAHWDRTESVTLPVYDHWWFHTDERGDFEYLARALDRPNRFECGYRRVVVDDRAARLRAAEDTPLFEPQVRHVATALTQGDGAASLPVPPPLAERLKVLLDRTAAGHGGKPIVGPPLYGQWPAGVTSLDGQPGTAEVAPPTPPSPQAWVAELNADPDLRVVAGLGARMVQRHQETLMAEAWAQLEAVEEANRRIRWAQLAAAAGAPLHDAFASLQPGQALRVARGLVVAAGESSANTVVAAAAAGTDVPVVSGMLTGTNVPDEVLSPTFMHVARYATAPPEPAHDDGENAAEWLSPTRLLDSAIDLLQAGSPDVVPAHFTAPAELDLERITEVIQQAEIDENVVAELTAAVEGLATVPDTLDQIAEAIVAEASIAETAPTVAGAGPDASVQPEDVVLVATAKPTIRAKLDAVLRMERATLDEVGFATAPSNSLVTQLRSRPLLPLPPAPAPPAAAEPGDLPALQVLGAQTRDVATVLDPEPSYHALLGAAITVNHDSRNHPQWPSPLQPVMATPVFLTPAVELLRAMDQEWVLGGLAAVDETDVIAVLTENHRFVEAFLAGANHEMARELRWRGFPTDLRGSCFRRFWPTLTASDGDGDDPLTEGTSLFDDVKPLHTWVDRLGDNRDVDVEHLTVVAIKGRLLRRYPNTVITVELGSHDGQTFTTVREARKLASGILEPDFAYLVFDADLTDEPDGNRWYVSLREPTDEPSFGLDTEEANQLTALAPRHGTSVAEAGRLFRQPYRLLLSAASNLGEGTS